MDLNPESLVALNALRAELSKRSKEDAERGGQAEALEVYLREQKALVASAKAWLAPLEGAGLRATEFEVEIRAPRPRAAAGLEARAPGCFFRIEPKGPESIGGAGLPGRWGRTDLVGPGGRAILLLDGPEGSAAWRWAPGFPEKGERIELTEASFLRALAQALAGLE